MRGKEEKRKSVGRGGIREGGKGERKGWRKRERGEGINGGERRKMQ